MEAVREAHPWDLWKPPKTRVPGDTPASLPVHTVTVLEGSTPHMDSPTTDSGALRLGSLCTGYGGLDIAVRSVFGGDLAWGADNDPGAARILAHHHHPVPNLGDITTTDWTTVAPVDVVLGRYPCQPFSTADKRKGTTDARHIWPHIADALRVLRPRYAVFENVAGHLSLGFDAVLSDLAALGFDAEWCTLRASDVGAAHQRNRLFVLYVDNLRMCGGRFLRSGVTLPSAASSVPWRAVPGARVNEITQLTDELAVIVRSVEVLAGRSVNPLLPETAWLEEPGHLTGTELGVEEQERADGTCLVVIEVRATQVSVEISDQEIGVGRRAKGGEGDAVCLPCIGSFACEQEFAEAFAEVGSVGNGDEPSCRLALTPSAVEEGIQFTGCDLTGGFAEFPRERAALVPAHPQEAAAEFEVAPVGRDIPADQAEQFGVLIPTAHGGILSGPKRLHQRFAWPRETAGGLVLGFAEVVQEPGDASQAALRALLPR